MLNYNKILVELHISAITGQMISSHACYYYEYQSSSRNLRRYSDVQV